MKINIFWFRRDLRLEDNTALDAALSEELPVLPVFIYDKNITDELDSADARISFINKALSDINEHLQRFGSSVYILIGKPERIWEKLIASFDINAVYINKDYEPYALHRDNVIKRVLGDKGINLIDFKDQVIFETKEVVKPDGNPYTIFTPYKNTWMRRLKQDLSVLVTGKGNKNLNFLKSSYPFFSLADIGFTESSLKIRPYDLSVISDYHKYRDLPAADKTSYLSPHLRFGTVSIRNLVKTALELNLSFLNELIWREFFMQILFNFPHVVTENFKTQYNDIEWRNNEKEFQRWCNGETGYPIVDAGMRQLNTTGYMHNRIRMITAGFLCKHLLIDWRWGEAYFAGKLLDYELSSNNGNWQWAAGTGCDAAPYFRIFNPSAQQKKFDPEKEYINKWINDHGRYNYPKEIIDHDFARKRALTLYKESLRRKHGL